MMMLDQIETGDNYLEGRDRSNMFVQGRLKPGVTVSEGEAALKTIAAQLAREYPTKMKTRQSSFHHPGCLARLCAAPL